MSIPIIRQIITDAGGTPSQYAHMPLLRELITAVGGTPTQFGYIPLLRELVTAAGGTPGSNGEHQHTTAGLLRSLIYAIGGTPETYTDDYLWAQVQGLGFNTAFDPLSVSPTVWWDASDLTKMFTTSGGTTNVAVDADPIGRIEDKSGNGSHLTQATAGSRPAYDITSGIRGWQNDGVDDILATAAGRTWSGSSDVFIVMSAVGADTNFILADSAGTGGSFIGAGTQGSGSAVVNDLGAGGQPPIYVDNAAAATRGDFFTATETGRNVVELRGVDLAAFGQMFLGRSYATFEFVGLYHEIFICPAQTAGVRTQLRDYFTTKWG